MQLWKTEHLRVQELVEKNESHLHRETFQADLEQNNVYNPFSNNSNAMIRQLGNVELIELCETIPKYHVLTVFFIGIEELCIAFADNSWLDNECRRKLNKNTALSIPNYVIKKGRSHGARHGKTEEQKEYHVAWNAWKRCCKKVDSQGEHFTGIQDRFLRDPVYRESRLAIGWTEQKLDEFAKEDHTYRLTPEEKRRYQGQWYLTLNKSGKHGPMKLRSDSRAAVSMKNRLHHESGEQVEEPISPEQYRMWHPLQAHRGGTSLNGIGNEFIRFF